MWLRFGQFGLFSFEALKAEPIFSQRSWLLLIVSTNNVAALLCLVEWLLPSRNNNALLSSKL